MPISTTAAIQGFIQARYPDELRDATERLCRRCAFVEKDFINCTRRLKPLTSEGLDCPYFLTCRTSLKSATGRGFSRALAGRR